MADHQRIDKWLWYARFFKTRGLAAKVIETGKVRLTVTGNEPERVGKTAQPVRPGDVLTFPQGNNVRVIKVLAPGTRRGPAAEAQALYEDLAPPQPKPKSADAAVGTPALREKGSGRPTKKERRTLDEFKGR